jgi:hypothetical protein
VRFFKTFLEMKSEVVRDLAELSVRVVTDTMQDKDISGDPNYWTREAQNYTYTVTSPDLGDLSPTQPWANMEFQERIDPSTGTRASNPGIAWLQRAFLWREFLHGGKFAYTYSERLGINPLLVVEELRSHPTSRQLFIPVWHPHDGTKFGIERIPCSLGYWLNWRQDQLNVTYLQRSSDFFAHFENDVYLARKLQEWIAQRADLKPGLFTHWLGSLHVFEKDVSHIF